MRRERYAILGDILVAIDRTSPPGELRVTAIAQRANLPHDRLTGYLSELCEAGLLTRGGAITREGREFLAGYREWREVLERFGLGPTPAAQGMAPRSPAHGRF